MATSNITVNILGDAKGFKGALSDAQSGLSRFSGSAVKAGKLAAVGIAATAAAATGVGVALVGIGSKFDTEFDKIRVGTGATGEALTGLQADFKQVLKDVPTDFAGAGTAIADLNTRLGLTGEPLQALSGQFINLARITGGDVATQIDNLTRVFGDAGLSQNEFQSQLDKTFRASQASGISIEQLTKQSVDYGAVTRNLGFTLDESTALFALFNKTGVNTETVFAGLKAGVGSLAKAGEDVPETFRRIVDEITELGPGSEATRKAIELFGQRSGPDLADAITGGKFALDDMLDAIQNGEDTINAAADETADFSEKWLQFKNRVLVGLEPIATRVFDAIGDLMDKLGPKIEPFIEQMEIVLPRVFDRVEQIFARFAPVVISVIETVIGFIATNWPPVQAVILQVFETVSAWVAENWPAIRDTIVEVMTTIGEIITAVVELVSAIWARWGDEILLVVETVFSVIGPIIQAALDIVLGVIRTVTALIRGDWDAVWNGIKDTLAGVWDLIQGVVAGALDLLAMTISIALEGVVQVFKDLPGNMLDALGDLGSLLYGAGTDVIAGLLKGLKDKAGEVTDFVGGLGGKIAGKFTSVLGISSPSQVFVSNGQAIADGLRQGLDSGLATVTAGLDSLTNIFSNVDISGFVEGIRHGFTAGLEVVTAGVAAITDRFSSAQLFANLNMGPLIAGIRDGFDTALSVVEQKLVSVARTFSTLDTSGLVDAVIEGWDRVNGIIEQGTNVVRAAVGALSKVFSTLDVTGFVDTVVDGWNLVLGVLNDASSQVRALMNSLTVLFSSFNMEGFVGSVSDGWDRVVAKSLAAARQVRAILTSVNAAAGGAATASVSVRNVPRFATGAVLDRETLFVGGEYPGAATNREIVTPEKLLDERIAKGMEPLLALLTKLVKSPGTTIENVTLYDGRDLFDVINRQAVLA